jgi:uncharacterized membrane protein
MEQEQQLDLNPPVSLFQMNLDAQNSYNLKSSSSWAKVLGVAGIITGIIIVILMAVTMSKLNQLDSYNSYSSRRRGLSDMFSGSTESAKLGLWIMIITGIIFIVGGIFSFNFGNKIGAALKSNDQNGLNNGFAALRNYFAIRAITIIIVLLIFLLSLSSSL